MTFKNKAELIDFIKHQTNITLTNDKTDLCNTKRNLLHTEINLTDKNIVLTILDKNNIRYEQHIKNSYFIMVK
jgi:hypothetical protein